MSCCVFIFRAFLPARLSKQPIPLIKSNFEAQDHNLKKKLGGAYGRKIKVTQAY